MHNIPIVAKKAILCFGARRETCPVPGTPCVKMCHSKHISPNSFVVGVAAASSPLASTYTKQIKNPIFSDEISLFSLVPGERLELSHRKATASKTVVSTISPPGQVHFISGSFCRAPLSCVAPFHGRSHSGVWLPLLRKGCTSSISPPK